MKKILGPMRRAIQDFNLIEDGDKIGVGVSGGKDSMVLLYALKLYQRFSPEKFQLEAFTVDLGFKGFNTKAIEKYCKSIDVPFNIKETNIKDIVFDIRKEKNPCSLCANMRRGAIHNALKEKGFNKLALGHHSDDAIDTLFLSLLYEGRLNTLQPLTYLDRKKIYVIRPLLYTSEQDIKNAIEKNNIPIVNNPCPVDKKTKREDMNKLVQNIYNEVPGAKNRILTAMKNKEGLKLWF
ncbi:tRNA 2-thiocytidine(32) synthetase TtcA [Anaerosalibacter bizertensis]|uniref:tRNA 2-thiocytidine(32) synthetase TtcA n=1 Tax=Anaerosalibacter bizertensis TaxID=932217 RepID=A0A9Q4ABT7_9FIRM|nr:ATP-binding protein [Anaerosalibacter bizertensis]MBV1817479.1 tRNA 2-thiocytidine(32) synthetase TtcA [Bacteroidales bacterium MSK.15.36]MCB5559068.1 tRNA 2-thiocytidine(32) synthetase TtcA [Anaerosalibacter bizertensis]MCG4564781.1 tRNA 2-thiocytidine(32) synthetase TtcA [Anaerosalibacter bizertensis]MCG4582519.1 tRNA 2-thiocytidine(32) synthetase TtcA [Anaerosalibacter bizertensis]